MGQRRNWTQEEVDILRERWGHCAIETIAENLERSRWAVLVKAHRMGLPPWLESGDFITLNQLILSVTGKPMQSYTIGVWIRRGLPVHQFRRSRNYRVKGVYLDEFWKWAEKNRSYLDFSNMELNALGEEPAWVTEQRKLDTTSHAQRTKEIWTKQEDDRLAYLLRLQRHSYAEIAQMMSRTEGSIARRCSKLGIKDRPPRQPAHTPWEEWQTAALADGIRAGESYPQISARIGKSEKAVRGMVGRTYLTEDRDRVRKILGEYAWGYNRPTPTVRQAMTLTEHSRRTLQQITRLAQLLLAYSGMLQKEDGHG